MLIMPLSGLRQAHPANLPQQVLRRLPAKRHGILLVVLFMICCFVGETPGAQRTGREEERVREKEREREGERERERERERA